MVNKLIKKENTMKKRKSRAKSITSKKKTKSIKPGNKKAAIINYAAFIIAQWLE